MSFYGKVKTVGRRKTNAYKFQDYDRFLNLLNKLGETTFIVQKGVHKFKTFEEANAWMEEAIVRTIIQKKQAETPKIEDLKKICQELNKLEAKYALVGGFAMHYFGLTRTTYDIDFLVSVEKENIRKIKEALKQKWVFEKKTA